jgi:hypothetical protein
MDMTKYSYQSIEKELEIAFWLNEPTVVNHKEIWRVAAASGSWFGACSHEATNELVGIVHEGDIAFHREHYISGLHCS